MEKPTIKERFFAAIDGARKGGKSQEQESLDYNTAQSTSDTFRFDQFQNEDTLVGKSGLEVYDKMMTDAEVSGAINEKNFNVISADWEITAGGDEDKHKEQAEFMAWTLEDMQGSVVRTTWNILSATYHGYSINERVMKPIDYGPWKGKWGIKQIRHVRPHEIEFKLSKSNELEEIWQQTPDGETYQMELERFIIYSYNPEYERIWGRSDLRAVYKHWWSKNFLIGWWNIYMETFGSPTRVGKYPAGDTSPSKQEDLKKVLRDIVNSTAITIPDDMDVTFLTAVGKAGFETAIRYHDEQIRKRIVGQTLTSGEGQRVGSMALGNIHQQTKESFTTFIRRELAESVFREQVIKPVIDMNYTDVDVYPDFVWQPRKGKVAIMSIEDANKAREGGWLVEGDWNTIRDRLDLPPSDAYDNDSDVPLEPMAQPAQGFGETPEKDVSANAEKPKSSETPKSDDKPVKDPDDMKDDDDDDDEERADFAAPEPWKPSRPLTKTELRMGGISYFAAKKQALDASEQKSVKKMRKDVNKIYDNLREQIEDTVYAGAEPDISLLGEITIPPEPMDAMKTETADQITRGYSGSYAETMGLSGLAKKSIPKINIAGVNEIPASDSGGFQRLIPKEVSREITKATAEGDLQLVAELRESLAIKDVQKLRNTFWVTDVTDTDMLNTVKKSLRESINAGISESESIANLRKVWDTDFSDARLRTIVRSNTSNAENEAFLTSARDPEYRKLVPQCVYSSVLDSGTTDFCKTHDGRVYRIDDPELARIAPINHINCRAKLYGITEEEVVPDSEVSVVNKSEVPAGFGGTGPQAKPQVKKKKPAEEEKQEGAKPAKS